jgi:hypothetical protein
MSEFLPAEFRQAFSEFTDPVVWPDAVLQRAHETALVFIPAYSGGARLHEDAAGLCPARTQGVPGGAALRLDGKTRELAIAYMTAHLLKLEKAAVSGDTTGLVSSATVDKVSVTLTPPPIKSQRDWWYGLTAYGSSLQALLRQKGAGGLYVGGAPPERAGFRKAGGVFVSDKVVN